MRNSIRKINATSCENLRTAGEASATSKNLTISRRRLMDEIGRRLDQVVQTITVYFSIQISKQIHTIVTFAQRYCLNLGRLTLTLHLHCLYTQEISIYKTFFLLTRKWLKARSLIFISLHAPFEQKIFLSLPEIFLSVLFENNSAS